MTTQQLKTPILLIAFNRPDTTQKVFDEIRKAKPKQFFMAVDGPRDDKPGDDRLCQTTRDIIKQVDWGCEVKTLFQEINLGCGAGPAQAITWFFENVEEGIILEDDCIPHQSFFWYCQELLEYYRDENKIMVISGDNFQLGKRRGDASYYFSLYPHIWGWATWRRAWKYFDFAITTLPEFKIREQIKNIFNDKTAQTYWLSVFQKVYGGHRKDIWDYQWLYAVWLHHGLTVIPNVNLISNIGFGPDATHTSTPNPAVTNIKSVALPFPLTHPANMEPDKKADAFTFSTIYYREAKMSNKIKKHMGRFINPKIKKIIKGVFSL